MWTRRASVCLIAGSVSAGGVDGVAAQSEPGAVERAMAYHIDGGGRWRQANQAFEPGGDAPESWVRVVRWGPGRDVVVADAFAVYESGRCEAIVHTVYRWDPGNGRVATSSFGAGGMHVPGFLEELGPQRDRVVATITLPDGTESRIRDTSELSRPHEYTTRAERWEDGAWVESSGARWVRDGQEGPCV